MARICNRRSISYAVLWNGLKKMVADFSEDEQHAITVPPRGSIACESLPGVLESRGEAVHGQEKRPSQCLIGLAVERALTLEQRDL